MYDIIIREHEVLIEEVVYIIGMDYFKRMKLSQLRKHEHFERSTPRIQMQHQY